jgi:transposase-like protein
VTEAAQAMNVGKSTMDKWVRQLREERSNNVLARFLHALSKKVGSCLKDGTNNVLSFLTHIAIDLMCPSLDLSIA